MSDPPLTAPVRDSGRAPKLSACAESRAAAQRRRRGHFRALLAAPSGPRSSARARRSLFASTDQSPRILRSEPVRTAPIPGKGQQGELLALSAATGPASQRS